MSANRTLPQPSQSPELLNQLRGRTRLLRYSKRTEEAYVGWATRFILFHGKRHLRVSERSVIRESRTDRSGRVIVAQRL